MKNQIRTIDLIAYFQARVAQFSATIEIEQEKWDTEKAKYEKTIWFRWFKQSFAESQKEGLFMYSKWDDLFYSRAWKNEALDILAQLSYREKCGFETTFWDFGYRWDDTNFYKWCAENNIPY